LPSCLVDLVVAVGADHLAVVGIGRRELVDLHELGRLGEGGAVIPASLSYMRK